MGYRSNVRIITSKKGYNELKKYTDEYLKKLNYNDYNLLDEAEVYGESKSIKYFGWDYIKWYEDCSYHDVDSIVSGLKHLSNNDYSYRFARFGEDYDDYEENNFNSVKREKIDLPYIYFERSFDDSYVADNLKQYEPKQKDVER